MSTKVVSLRLPEEIYCKLEEKAVNEGKQIVILVKEIIEKHTKSYKTTQKSCIY
jgi:predicted DNA-binding protein